MDSRPRAYWEYVWNTWPSAWRKQLRPGMSYGWLAVFMLSWPAAAYSSRER